MDRAQEAKVIREEWFADHIASLAQHGDLQALNWKRPSSIMYACRYIFDGSKMYISGDIGTAVFALTWKANVHSFNDTCRSYFHSKLSAHRGEKYSFCSEAAVKRLREWVKDLKGDGRKYDHLKMQGLFEEARQCSSKSEWDYILNNHDDFISELDQDYNEWARSAGNVIPIEVHAYLIGLQMASEQLKNHDERVAG
ncbi:hypothetical protein [Sporomusa malonica]|uniref:Uncharacterized protein n=1 Tax=Sporomusa malonica TaxID=112901 RepID=A0A1W2ATP1_9FIRM|nr:hypothetical protein [Sporomusa malonica]SMC63954.1 hypothetical protein SAMN04488500_106102 [Sporomusa malonica]